MLLSLIFSLSLHVMMCIITPPVQSRPISFRPVWSHRAVTGVCGGKRCLFVWAGRVGRRHVIALCI